MSAGSAGMTVREARAAYLARNRLGDGGYGDRWVRLQAGPVPIVFPNTAARVAAVRIHDVHHALTGFGTDWTGEAEIGAWEIGGGCAHHLAAWLLNLAALAIGVVIAPQRVLRAFAAGRRAGNLYRDGIDDALLDTPLDDARERLGIARPPSAAGPADLAAFAGWAALGAATLAATAALAIGAVAAPCMLAARAFAP